MKRAVQGICLAMMIMVSAIGCAMPGLQTRSSEETTFDSSMALLQELQVAPELRLKDLPVPAGYVYLPAKSMIVEYGSTQAGILYYEGPDDPADLIAFFRREMPKYGWRMESMIERDVARMLFDRPERTAELTIGSAGLGRKASITIYYAPKEKR